MSRFHDLLRKATVEEKAPPGAPEGRSTQVENHSSGAAAAPSALAAESSGLGYTGPHEASGFMGLHEALERLCPRSSWSSASTALPRDRSRYTSGMEEFRSLRSRLSLVREKQKLQKLLITSPLPKEGKTFVAANLAQVMLWQHECRLLLIDGDLRAPTLHALLGAPAAPGLADYLSGDTDEFSVIKRGDLDNLFFIPGGKPTPNASELLANGKLGALLERMSTAFDWILIDSPPAIPVSDPQLIAELCDGVLMVVRAASTPFDLAQKAYHEFRQRPFLGVVLNQVEQQSAYGYYYQDGPNGTNKDGKRRL